MTDNTDLSPISQPPTFAQALEHVTEQFRKATADDITKLIQRRFILNAATASHPDVRSALREPLIEVMACDFYEEAYATYQLEHNVTNLNRQETSPPKTQKISLPNTLPEVAIDKTNPDPARRKNLVVERLKPNGINNIHIQDKRIYANLSLSSIIKHVLFNCDFSNSTLYNTTFRNTAFDTCRFDKINGQKSQWVGKNSEDRLPIVNCSFRKADLSHAIFTSANIENTSDAASRQTFTRTNLTGTIFNFVAFNNVDFNSLEPSDVEGLVFHRCYFKDCTIDEPVKSILMNPQNPYQYNKDTNEWTPSMEQRKTPTALPAPVSTPTNVTSLVFGAQKPDGPTTHVTSPAKATGEVVIFPGGKKPENDRTPG